MPNTADFIAWVIELAQPTARVSARAMFGGHGLYADGIIFAIVVDDTLYLKTDDRNRADFAAQGLLPFVYASRNGERTAMSYYRAPDDALESPEAMAHVAALGDGRVAACGGRRRPKTRPARAKPTTPAQAQSLMRGAAESVRVRACSS